LTIQYNGHVGIGVTNPSNTLEVLNDIIISGASHCVLTLNADTNNYGENQTGRIDFKQDGGVLNSYIGGGNNELVIANAVPETSSGGMRFMLNNTTTVINSYDESLYAETQANMTTAMYITPSGRVGIGTDNPLRTLHVYDDSDTPTISYVAIFEITCMTICQIVLQHHYGMLLLKTSDGNNYVSSAIRRLII
jgi:hypothetical protein